MELNHIEDRLIEYFALRGKAVGTGENLFSADIIDSMGVVELVHFIETDLGIEMRQDMMRAENFATIEKIAVTVKAAER
jgi:acyl carrier protein